MDQPKAFPPVSAIGRGSLVVASEQGRTRKQCGGEVNEIEEGHYLRAGAWILV
jgi:hypothetical protein